MKIDLTNDKIRVFNTLVIGIETAIEQKSARLFIKGLSVLGDNLDVVAEREEWPDVLQKAKDFFESIEDYEKCAKIKKIADFLKNTETDDAASQETAAD